jgi:predicted transport protein
MPIFKIDKNKLLPIKELKIKLEKDLQEITEKNLETVFGLKFISTELKIHNFRIDTLAFDTETKSFVIFEYKKDRSFSVVDQGFAYLSVMLNNKADFILEYNEKMKDNLKRGDVDWSQSRVIFISTNFTSHQKNSINFKDLPIEIWEVKKYDNNTILYNQIKAHEVSESIKTISKDKTIVKVSKEVKKYSVEDHFKEGWDESKELYEALREKILELDSRLEEHAQKNYIGYSIDKSNVFSIQIYKSKILVELYRVRPQDLKDPEKRVRYRKKSFKYYHKHISLYDIKDEEDIDYAMFLIKQVYERFVK